MAAELTITHLGQRARTEKYQTPLHAIAPWTIQQWEVKKICRLGKWLFKMHAIKSNRWQQIINNEQRIITTQKQAASLILMSTDIIENCLLELSNIIAET